MTTSLVSKMLVKEIAELCENFGIGKLSGDGTDRTIFIGTLPEDTVEGLWIIETISPPPHVYIDAEYPVLDFWAISPHTDRAHALLELVYNNFHRRYAYETRNWHISFSHALGNINDVDRQEGGKLFRLSVQFICRNLNNVS